MRENNQLSPSGDGIYIGFTKAYSLEEDDLFEIIDEVSHILNKINLRADIPNKLMLANAKKGINLLRWRIKAANNPQELNFRLLALSQLIDSICIHLPEFPVPRNYQSFFHQEMRQLERDLALPTYTLLTERSLWAGSQKDMGESDDLLEATARDEKAESKVKVSIGKAASKSRKITRAHYIELVAKGYSLAHASALSGFLSGNETFAFESFKQSDMITLKKILQETNALIFSRLLQELEGIEKSSHNYKTILLSFAQIDRLERLLIYRGYQGLSEKLPSKTCPVWRIPEYYDDPRLIRGEVTAEKLHDEREAIEKIAKAKEAAAKARKEAIQEKTNELATKYFQRRSRGIKQLTASSPGRIRLIEKSAEILCSDMSDGEKIEKITALIRAIDEESSFFKSTSVLKAILVEQKDALAPPAVETATSPFDVLRAAASQKY